MGKNVDFSKMEFNTKDRYVPSRGINSGFDSDSLIKTISEHKNKPVHQKQEKIDERVKQIEGLQNFQATIKDTLNDIKENNDGVLNYLSKKTIESSDNGEYITINTHDDNDDFFYKFEDIQLSKPCVAQIKSVKLNEDITDKT
ncbi:MAG: hypothetical protein OEY79_03635, partial [Anaplasmataceae bacterium]|nr:hypothetical protein [Anaplasmataceae bacterium]